MLALPSVASAKDVNQIIIDQFGANDWDRDGGLNFSEFMNWTHGNGGNLMGGAAVFQRSDTNGDGVVTAQEYLDNLETV
ncbi:hypothetical protein CAP40_04605 [Sphingomonas sp. IBVSS2]|nr:hypothetical protein CAP40_04605 [Sphingomonas sp. IBVSS2]